MNKQEYDYCENCETGLTKTQVNALAKEIDIAKTVALKEIGKISPVKEGAYGLTFYEKPVSISYDGIGKVEMMTLSESGKRKMSSILEWNFETGQTDGLLEKFGLVKSKTITKATVTPPAHRTKDIVDFYVILRSFKGQSIADDWARIFGYEPKKLLEMAAETKAKEVLWQFTPATNKGKSLSGAKTKLTPPTVTLNQPDGLKPIKGASPAIIKAVNDAITSPSLLVKATPKELAKAGLITSPSALSLSAPTSSLVKKPSFSISSPSLSGSKEITTSPSASASIPASLKASASAPASKSISTAASSPTSKPATSSKTSITSASSPAASVPVSTPTSSPALSPPSSPPSSPPASPPSSPPSSPPGSPPASPPGSPPYPPYRPPSPPREPPSKPRYRSKYDDKGKKNRKYPKGTVAWKQGFIWIIKVPPVKPGDQMETIYSRKAPTDAPTRKRTPDETFYTRGTPPAHISHSMGVVNVDIRPKVSDSLLFTPSGKKNPLSSPKISTTSDGRIKVGRRKRM